MNNAKSALLIKGSVGKTLVKLAIPMIFGMIGLIVFNLVDAFFVGQLGTNELAAMSFTFPVVLVVNSLAMGLGVGASAVISRAIGAGDHYRVQRLTTDSLALGVLVVALFVVAGLLTIDPLFRLLGATPEVRPFIKQYMRIWYLGVIFVVIPMTGNNAIRATGDTKTPAIIMLVAAGVNLAVDPMLIFGFGPIPRLELAGAALATVIARATTLIVSLSVLYYREQMITFARPALRAVIDSWKKILYIGLPAAGTNIIIPVSMGIITSLVAAYGPAAVAGFGVSSRIESFALTGILALSSVIGPFIGQNWGAGKSDRVILGVRRGQQFALGWGAVACLLLAAAARPIAGLFSDNPDVVATITLYLRIVPISYGLQGVLLVTSATLNVLNRPLHSAALSLLRMIVLYVPLAYAGSSLIGLPGVFGAAALANVLAGAGAFLWLNRTLTLDEGAILAQATP